MAYHNGKQNGFIEHNGYNIDKVLHNGNCVFTQGFDREASGTDSVVLDGTIGKGLMDWSIVGNTVQDGVPSPDNIVEVKGLGDKTPNLFDFDTTFKNDITSFDGEYYYLTISPKDLEFTFKPDTQYTISFTGKNLNTGRGILFRYYYTDGTTTEIASTTDLVFKYLTSIAGKSVQKLRISYGSDTSVQIKNIMLNEGSTALPYEPFGYKIPMVSRGKNLCPPDILQERLDFTNGAPDYTLNYSATDYFEMSFYDINDRVSFNGLPNDVASCVFVYDENHVFIGRSGNNTRASLSVKPDVFVNGSGTKEYDKIKYARISISKPNYDGMIMVHHWDVRDLPSEFQPYEPYYSPITTNIYLPTLLMANEMLTPTEREVKWGKYVFNGEETFNTDKELETTKRFYTNASLGLPQLIGASSLYGSYSSHFLWKRVTELNITDIVCFSTTNTTNNIGQLVFRVSKTIANTTADFKAWLKSEYDKGTPVTVWYQLANPTTESVETNPIGTLRNEEKTIKGTTTIITTDTEVLPTQIETSYKSNKADYVVVNFATTDGNIFTTTDGDTYTIKMRKSQYDTMMTNELLNLLEVM